MKEFRSKTARLHYWSKGIVLIPFQILVQIGTWFILLPQNTSQYIKDAKQTLLGSSMGDWITSCVFVLLVNVLVYIIDENISQIYLTTLSALLFVFFAAYFCADSDENLLYKILISLYISPYVVGFIMLSLYICAIAFPIVFSIFLLTGAIKFLFTITKDDIISSERHLLEDRKDISSLANIIPSKVSSLSNLQKKKSSKSKKGKNQNSIKRKASSRVTRSRMASISPPSTYSHEDTVNQLENLENTDGRTKANQRAEQSKIRETLFPEPNEEYICACCKEKYPSSFLVAAHIKKRAYCTNSERLDDSNTFPLCKNGCDDFFELGLLIVKNGEFMRNSLAKQIITDDLIGHLDKLDKSICRQYNTKSSKFFKWHEDYHS